MAKKINKNKQLDAALGAGVRKAALAQGNGGFIKTHRVHKSKKAYTRKPKHKNNVTSYI